MANAAKFTVSAIVEDGTITSLSGETGLSGLAKKVAYQIPGQWPGKEAQTMKAFEKHSGYHKNADSLVGFEPFRVLKPQEAATQEYVTQVLARAQGIVDRAVAEVIAYAPETLENGEYLIKYEFEQTYMLCKKEQ